MVKTGVYYSFYTNNRRFFTLFKTRPWRTRPYNLTFLFLILIILTYLLLKGASNMGDMEREAVCKLPNLPINNFEIMKYMTKMDPITCKQSDGSLLQDWVISNGTHAYLTDTAKAKYDKNIICTYQDIERVDENFARLSAQEVEGTIFEFKNSDFVRVSCTSMTKAELTTWKSYLVGTRTGITIPKATKQSSKVPQLNILIWGHDSLSSNMFQRKLPLTFALLQKLDGVLLKGYNVVGDGTPQAFIPMLTGQTESDLPEVRTRMGSTTHYMNVYPFVWNEFKAHGYLTGFIEDCPQMATFNYRLKGFKEAPTDYYMRPYFQIAYPYLNQPRYCIGGLPRHKIMLNYISHIFKFRKNVPKFVFGFQGELSHDTLNDVQGADLDVQNFVADLNRTNILNNTVLLIMSDHGARFSNIRQTPQGKQEERMPFFMFVFPQWFKTKFKIAYQNFVSNSARLSTPFDIHATVQDILKISTEDVPPEYFQQANQKQFRQMSLFRPIPLDRSCKDAAIEIHWCACLEWNSLLPESDMAKKAVTQLVAHINNYIESKTTLCAPLMLRRIVSAANLMPNNELLKFRKSTDLDGLIPDMSDVMTPNSDTLQIHIETLPGLTQFDATLTFALADQHFDILENQISRINKHGQDSSCLPKNLDHVRKFCYCLDNDRPEMTTVGKT